MTTRRSKTAAPLQIRRAGRFAEALHRAGGLAKGIPACSACHGPTGSGNPASKFPALAGQHSKYTGMQLEAFSKAQRANDAGQMMRNVANKMTDAEMAAVSEYIAGLQNQ